jgi:hypothetical protein
MKANKKQLTIALPDEVDVLIVPKFPVHALKLPLMPGIHMLKGVGKQIGALGKVQVKNIGVRAPNE